MPVQVQSPRDADYQRWGLDDWNNALYLQFFASAPNAPTVPVVTLNVTGEDLREAVGAGCTGLSARAAFIDAIKRGIGSRSLAADALCRSARWSSALDSIPPFLSHLLLTCMIANDLSEELQWTADLRIRLSQVLDTEAQQLPRQIRFLWEDLAVWSVRQSIAGAGCRQLRLPQIPDAGYHSIIGYSIKLAVPSRRDQTILATLLRQNGLDRKEPEINTVLSVVNANITRFSSDFQAVFTDFVAAFKSKRFALLAQTAFWTAVRAVALASLEKPDMGGTALCVRLELEDDDGSFWLALTSDGDLRSGSVLSLALPTPRQSSYRFLLTHPNGDTLTDVLFSDKTVGGETEKALSTIRSAITEGLLLFEEADDYVHVLSSTFPSSGRILALVSDRLKASFALALQSTGIAPDIRKSAFLGWSEWRGLTGDALRAIDLSKIPSLHGVRGLRLTIPPPEIKFRGGIRQGSSFIAMSGLLPAVEILDADQVSVELLEGEWQPLVRRSEELHIWQFNPELPSDRLLGAHRIVAFASAVPIAERTVSFVETAFGHAYKAPNELERWLVESLAVDMTPFPTAANSVKAIAEEPTTLKGAHNFVDANSGRRSAPEPLAPLITLFGARFSAQRGLSEGELVEIMKAELGVKPGKVWPVLRGWLEAGMLDVLTDARWRARIYFARVPQLVVCRRRGFHEAVLTGLVPPYLVERFDALSAALRVSNLERRSVSPFVPSLPRCRANRVSLLAELARELNLSGIVSVRSPQEMSIDIRGAATKFCSTTSDSWPLFRKWDWNRRIFSEAPFTESMAGISLVWCRRDDGPDRYKVYKDGSLLWWTRSRTWAVLAALTLADLPIFNRDPDGSMYSQGDSVYLPLPIARAVAWTAPTNSGPVTLRDGNSAYRYTFHDDWSRDLLLTKMWPQRTDVARPVSSSTIATLNMILSTSVGPRIPVPVGLKQALDKICDHSELRAPSVAPLSAVPRLYALVAASRAGGL